LSTKARASTSSELGASCCGKPVSVFLRTTSDRCVRFLSPFSRFYEAINKAQQVTQERLEAFDDLLAGE
jgi:hypothetical protein